MTAEVSTWTILYSNKSKKSALKLPLKVGMQLGVLAKEMEILGPYRTNWSHYGPLTKGPGVSENAYHCHIKSGHPTYVVCWKVEDKKMKIIEIFYVGTHENAPY